MDRRAFLRGATVVAGGALLLGPRPRRVAANTSGPIAADGPYGPLQPTNSDGLMLPAGFTSRFIARSGSAVGSTSHVWHAPPDGGACVARDAGGWIYVSNGEAGSGGGGVAAIAFDPAGTIVDAYSILSGTSRSCSGGTTPWGSYLSGEENGATGRVFECDPQRRSQGVHRPLLGAFNHEMIAVDPATGEVYMVEDHASGRLYKFVPTTFGDLSAGLLYAAHVTGSQVTWVPTSASAPDRSAATTVFNGGEGAWVMRDTLYFTTKGDVRVWRLDLRAQQLSVLYDGRAVAGTSLTAVDNLVGHLPSGDLYVAEDGGNMEVVLVTTIGPSEVAPFLRFVGHDASEVTGIAFTPDHGRLYVTSQRGSDGVHGLTYEISGPFRRSPRSVIDQPRRPHPMNARPASFEGVRRG